MEKVRKKMVVVRMNDEEYQQLEKLRQKTTTKYLSSYARKILLQKPVVVKYRNTSADEFLKEMILLKKELNSIGNNFNQAVHKLHLVEKIPEFRTWILNYDLQKALLGKTEEIRRRIEEIHQQLQAGALLEDPRRTDYGSKNQSPKGSISSIEL
jgi:hypothetical protein